MNAADQPLDITLAMKETAEAVTRTMDRWLALPEGPEARVVEAMRHSALGGGKRLRPFLVMESARLFGVSDYAARQTAAAVEFLHCYSLIHDDLPAMDDAETRRGRPSCHVAFDEATAILAGDALLTLAFEILSDPDTHGNPAVRADLCRGLARASGHRGMVGGQMIDLLAEKEPNLDIHSVIRLQRMKTGALICFSAEAGAILGRAGEPARHALHSFGQELGLAFQIADDVLDHEGDAETVGKPVGRDDEAGKATFVTLLGLDGAKERAGMLADQAAVHLEHFGSSAARLAALARFVIDRKA
ncbi:MAG: polyprenyl synthetase family protein [Alphaproteobacteria bacterium]|nr:polyprenyl synthetase family protein [Alphaproteobacteria bacterium]